MVQSLKSAELPGRLPAISVQEMFERDAERHPVPQGMREEFNDFIGGRTEVEVARYTSRDYHRLEQERMWSRVWQWACRADQLREVGDHVVYEIGRRSVIVVRSSPTEIKAFHNACLHRGRTLCDKDGRSGVLRCRFHGFTWGLDGSLRVIPEAWDFTDLNRDEFCLPEVRVETWGGFVFVNFDLWEVLVLMPHVGDTPPPSARFRILADDEGWVDTPEMGVRGAFLQQDLDNLPWIQRGLRAAVREHIVLANYHESLVRHFHYRLDEYIERSDLRESVPT